VIDTLSQFSVLSLYSAMAIYAIAFIVFTFDLARGAGREANAAAALASTGSARHCSTPRGNSQSHNSSASSAAMEYFGLSGDKLVESIEKFIETAPQYHR
jgi:hypothetical protein